MTYFLNNATLDNAHCTLIFRERSHKVNTRMIFLLQEPGRACNYVYGEHSRFLFTSAVTSDVIPYVSL